ncbi:dTDP-4-dehydrorhamnose 3,5-epimerase [Cochlodiniinecator piscidefendens]|uniref:dTDP-4-dehydrorhamnose 3,5-epimerase n=1 Tax=Cochlodiniinecator piscidefendens TaxID=2715756 RepID=UPI001407B621|nr:dTDP-4-dehydrorhamnose 3,5-epimerase [Cochlodiniinecator piscidefendens]
MNIERTPLAGLLILTPDRFTDARGFFSESWNKKRLIEFGLNMDFVQDNHSLSQDTGTIRGLHYQSPPHAQGKLVRCGRGCLFDVAVDIRLGSPTYKQWFGIELSFDNGKQLYIPEGFLHGFVTRAPMTEVIYKCTDYYAPRNDGAVRFDDPELDIDWGIQPDQAKLSDKDMKAPYLHEIGSPFEFTG